MQLNQIIFKGGEYGNYRVFVGSLLVGFYNITKGCKCKLTFSLLNLQVDEYLVEDQEEAKRIINEQVSFFIDHLQGKHQNLKKEKLYDNDYFRGRN